MVIDMNLLKLTTRAQVREFLQGTQILELVSLEDAQTRYAHVARTLDRLGYAQLGRKDRSVVLRCLERTCGYASAQVRLSHSAMWPRRTPGRSASRLRILTFWRRLIAPLEPSREPPQRKGTSSSAKGSHIGVRRAPDRGTRSVLDVADDLHMSAGTLRKWIGNSNKAKVEMCDPAANA